MFCCFGRFFCVVDLWVGSASFTIKMKDCSSPVVILISSQFTHKRDCPKESDLKTVRSLNRQECPRSCFTGAFVSSHR